MTNHWDRKWRPASAESNLTLPLGWRKTARALVDFDLFAEGVPDEWIDRVFAVMALAPQHTFQVLTKRAERARNYLSRRTWPGRLLQTVRREPTSSPLFLCGWAPLPDWPLPKVWLGVSVEDQKSADERIPLLLDTPAEVRFISAEPLLGPIDLRHLRRSEISDAGVYRTTDALTGAHGHMGPLGPTEAIDRPTGKLDWVIAGGESGTGARPMHPDWARALRDQCQAAGVPFFFKQWGEHAVYGHHPGEAIAPGRSEAERYGNIVALDKQTTMARVGKRAAGRLLDGREWSEFPNA